MIATLPLAFSQEFAEYANALQWRGNNSLDWEVLGSFTSIDASAASEDELVAWVQTTNVAKHSHLAFFKSRREACVVVPLEAAMRNNESFCYGPETFCFGVDVLADRMIPNYSAIIQMSTLSFYARLA